MTWTLPLVSLGAGLISFTSPCCVPLVPGYLSYVSALPISELDTRRARALTLRASLLFVAGFAVAFTALGASVGLVGAALLRQMPVILRVAGVGIIVMGLATLGFVRMPFLYRERRLDLARVSPGIAGAFTLGLAFAVGWVPCIGPVLATIFTLAGSTSSVAWGALLLAIYSIGLGIPFVLVGMFFTRSRTSLSWLTRHGRRIEQIGSVLLVVIGILFVTGRWQSLFVPLQRSFAQWGWPPV
jgi:cytochrome c-type biogenesis protein